VWSSSLKTFPCVRFAVRLEGRSIVFPDGFWVIPSQPKACLAAIEAALALSASSRYSDVPLAEILAREQREVVPAALAEVGAFLQARSGDEGIFRVSGSARVVKRLMMHIDEGCLHLSSSTSTADVASLLKMLLGRLKVRLPINFEGGVHEQVLAACPETELLRWLFGLLRDCADNSAKSRMTDTNLAMVFSPVLVPDLDLINFAAVNQLVLRMIQEFK
jgi:hypothetical protein